jgi:hypothetical protein
MDSRVAIKPSLRKDQPVKSLRGVREGIRGVECRAGGRDGAVHIDPVARAQVGT